MKQDTYVDEGSKGKLFWYSVVLKKDYFSFTTHKENYDHHDKVYDHTSSYNSLVAYSLR